MSTKCDDNSHQLILPEKPAGRLAHFLAKWQALTSDKWLIDTIQHYHIEFSNTPFQKHIPREICFSDHESSMITDEIAKMLQKGAIVETHHSKGEYISNIFLRPKKDGSFRPIINLRGLNAFVAYHHFKMETIRYAIQLVRLNCFMASIDLKDAYFSVPIAKEHRKFLRFQWQNKLYEFTCLPFGLACAPRVFTKVMKPLVASLRQRGFESCDYIDDSLLIGATFQECAENVHARTTLTRSLGFIVNEKKSIFVPTQQITFLGFALNSVDMTISVPPHKVEHVILKIREILGRRFPKIRDVASVIGLLVSCELALPYGPLFRRTLENEKNEALAQNDGNFEAIMSISTQATSDLQ